MRKFLTGMRVNLGTAGELLGFFKKRKLWWLIPMVAVLMLFAILLIFAHSSGVGALLYPLF
jgi:hypothetical protein